MNPVDIVNIWEFQEHILWTLSTPVTDRGHRIHLQDNIFPAYKTYVLKIQTKMTKITIKPSGCWMQKRSPEIRQRKYLDLESLSFAGFPPGNSASFWAYFAVKTWFTLWSYRKTCLLTKSNQQYIQFIPFLPAKREEKVSFNLQRFTSQ